MTHMVERYVASMVLSGVGDAMGFKNARWEFCMSGPQIHKELKKLGGVSALCVALPKWRVSDDTVMHLATGDALVSHGTSTDQESLYLKTAAFYKNCMSDMQARSAGATCSSMAFSLKPTRPKGHHIPFNPRGGGCGAAMRAMCIGLRFPREEDLDDLICYAVESGRMTHHHPTGYLGAVAAALFTSYSIQGKPRREWGAGLMAVLEKASAYVASQGRYVDENKQAWSYFKDHWTRYLKDRRITDGASDPVFPKKYDVKARDEFYSSVSFSGWGGASGHDAPMIAYDALLGSGDSWEELCHRGVLHGGDNDSTGVIVGACYGATYGFNGVPENNYKNIEYHQRLAEMGVRLYELSHPGEVVPASVLESLGLATISEGSEDSSAVQVQGTAEGATNTPDGATNSPAGTSSTPEGATNTPDGATNTPEGATNTPEGATNAPEGATNTQEKAPNAPDGARQSPEGADDTSESNKDSVNKPEKS